MMTIRRAVDTDLRTVREILLSVAADLHARGIDQWPAGSASFTPEKIGSQIERGEFWIASDDGDPVAVIAISPEGDPDFWTPAELTEPAVYLSKAAVIRPRAGQGIGEMTFRWATDWAWRHGCAWVRLDAWRTNTALHGYYWRRGWSFIRMVDSPGRKSGALFARPAAPDAEARGVFTEIESPSCEPPEMTVGTPVIAVTRDGPLACVITDVIGPDWSHGEVEQPWEHGVGVPQVFYEVARGGRRWLTTAAQVWPDPAACSASIRV